MLIGNSHAKLGENLVWQRIGCTPGALVPTVVCSVTALVTNTYWRNIFQSSHSMGQNVLYSYTTSQLSLEPHMEMTQATKRIHPLVAGAAASVMLVSLLGAAAIAGILPSSHSTAAQTAQMAAQPAVAASAPAAAALPQQAATVPVAKEVVEPQTVVHHQHVQHAASHAQTRPTQVAQAAPAQQHAPAPVYQQPAAAPQPVAQNSPVGIAAGAVVGGLLGNQVGKGNGKTLATIAGAVGGGYVGNEIAKRY